MSHGGDQHVEPGSQCRARRRDSNAGHGDSEAGRGNLKAGRGDSEAVLGDSETGRGDFKAGRGDFEAGPSLGLTITITNFHFDYTIRSLTRHVSPPPGNRGPNVDLQCLSSPAHA